LIQSGDISAESLNWVSESIGISNKELLSKGEKLRIESSQRTFFRIPYKDKSSILMVVPRGIDESIESFYTKAKIFKKANVNVPDIYFKNEALGLLIVKDFGDDVLQFYLNKQNSNKLIKLAIEQIHKIEVLELDKSIFLDFEKITENNLNLFKRFFLEEFLNVPELQILKEEIEEFYSLIISELKEFPQVISHYDFESRNLISLSDEKIGVIDFQDALIGPLGIDLASLFKDLYIEWTDEEISNWLDFYVENSQITKSASLKSKDVKRMIDFASLQRQIRILGKLSQVFLKLNRSERLKDFKTILNYLINTSSEYNETKRFSNFFKNLIPILELRLKTL
jgi:aminoglycoside/choline kinase family phosphotransferase